MSLTDGELISLRSSLLGWFQANKREMPWRESRDPYKIWLSEVMLQQTRVDQATPYYQRFVQAYPTVIDLARADMHDVLMLWEGLGYYSRGRNLHKAAQVVVEKYDGTFPSSYDALLSLPGVGPYTAAAVSSIAFGKPHAVVDGNVVRVISRLMGISDDVRHQSTKSSIQSVADHLLDPSYPGDFNQAVMEIGSLVCTPSKPTCNVCPIAPWCVASKTAQTDSIPYKTSKAKIPHHDIVVAIISNTQGELLIARRPENVMLGGLWEFPGGKVNANETIEQALHREIAEELGIQIEMKRKFMHIKHAYSHFKITLHSFLCDHVGGEPTPNASTEIRWVAPRRLGEFPFPKANRKLTLALMGESDG
jgi:A/G-specific adenine glycosylase